jgi:hypothetical protein
MTQPRHPTGTPAGGQFAPSHRARPVIELYDPRAELRSPHLDRFAAGPLTAAEEEQLTGDGIEVTDEVRQAAERYFSGDVEAVLPLLTSAMIAVVKLDSRRRYALLDGTVEDPRLRARFAMEAPLTASELSQVEDAGWAQQAADAAVLHYLGNGQLPDEATSSQAAGVKSIVRARLQDLGYRDPEAERVYAGLADRLREEAREEAASRTFTELASEPDQPRRRLRDRIRRR